jgi:hypothetical protein
MIRASSNSEVDDGCRRWCESCFRDPIYSVTSSESLADECGLPRLIHQACQDNSTLTAVTSAVVVVVMMYRLMGRYGSAAGSRTSAR